MKKHRIKRLCLLCLALCVIAGLGVSAASATTLTFPNSYAVDSEEGSPIYTKEFDVEFTDVTGCKTYDYSYEELGQFGPYVVEGTYYVVSASVGATFKLPFTCDVFEMFPAEISDLGKPSMSLDIGDALELQEINFNGKMEDTIPGYEYKSFSKGGVVTLDRAGTFRMHLGEQMSDDMKWVEFVVQVGTTPPAGTDKPAAPTAAATQSPVLIDGVKTPFQAYNINQNNYFKLRDIASAINGSAKQFEVVWDSAVQAIQITTGKAYTPVGGEMEISDTQGNKTPVLNSAPVYLNGKLVELTAYTINGNNYFKLRDLGAALGFNVSWDSANKSIVVDTTQAYTAD